MTEATIFQNARDIQDPARRAGYLDAVCAADAALRRRVETLIAAGDASGEFLDVPAIEQMARQPGLDTVDADEDDLNFLAPPTQPGHLGRLGRYDVLEVLGRGGFGIVLKAFDTTLHRMVAIKVLARAFAATSPPRKRFLREARAAAAVRHENVVAVHAVEESPLPHLVMEYIPGETLQQHIDRVGPLDAGEVRRLGSQVAEGLAAAHAMGLIHRDVKPANVLLEAGPEPRVKLTDFGLARTADDASVTQSGQIIGTPMYMAPEQALGKPFDQRADLFSLGSLLYVMTTGRPPFRADSTLAVLRRVTEDTPRPIRDIIPEAPPWLCAVIAKLHAKDPANRYATAQDVVEALASGQGPAMPTSPEPRRLLQWWGIATAVFAGLVSLGLLRLNDDAGENRAIGAVIGVAALCLLGFHGWTRTDRRDADCRVVTAPARPRVWPRGWMLALAVVLGAAFFGVMRFMEHRTGNGLVAGLFFGAVNLGILALLSRRRRGRRDANERVGAVRPRRRGWWVLIVCALVFGAGVFVVGSAVIASYWLLESSQPAVRPVTVPERGKVSVTKEADPAAAKGAEKK